MTIFVVDLMSEPLRVVIISRKTQAKDLEVLVSSSTFNRKTRTYYTIRMGLMVMTAINLVMTQSLIVQVNHLDMKKDSLMELSEDTTVLMIHQED